MKCKPLNAAGPLTAVLCVLGLSSSLAGTGDTSLNKNIVTSDIAPVTPAIVTNPWHTGDPIQFLDGQLVFDVQERVRMESRNNNFDFSDATRPVTDDTWFLQRFRLGLLYKPEQVSWLKFYVSGQDTRELGSARPDEPFVLGSEGDDTFDLREANVEIGDLTKFPVSAKIGRQVLSFGEERLIGGFEWNNFGRTFDAINLTYKEEAFSRTTFNAFAGNVVNIRGYEFPNDSVWKYNNSNRDDILAGLYASSKAISFQKTEFYFIYRNKADNGPIYATQGAARTVLGADAYDAHQEVYTIGNHLISTSPGYLKGFDYEQDFAYQFGRVAQRTLNAAGVISPAANGNSVRQSAFAGHAAGGYNFELTPWTPRLGVDYSIASGGNVDSSSQSNTFSNLFPTNHKFYGNMDLFSWKNMHSLDYNLTAKPNSKITLRFDHRFAFLYTNEDAWYRANGVTAVRNVNTAARNAGNFLGHEVDLTATYAYAKWLNFQTGYSHFFAGQYLADTGVADGANFLYVQTTVKF